MSQFNRSAKSWKTRLLAAAVILLFSGVSGEIYLRATGAGLSVENQIKLQAHAASTPYASDPDLGALLAPDRNELMETPEFTYALKTDHAGFTNHDPWPDSIDVAVLGDSLLIGAGVGLEGQFTTLLQNRLTGSRVLNFGLPGAGTEHQHRVYRKFVQALRPKLVIATLWLTWDVDNSLHFHYWLAERSNMDFTVYRMTFGDTHPPERPQQPARPPRPWDSAQSLLRRSRLLQTAYRRIQQLRRQEGPIDRSSTPSGETIYLSVRGQERLARGLDRPGIPEIQDIFFDPLVQLKAEVEAHEGQFVIVLIPSKEELYAADAFPEALRLLQQTKKEFASRQLPTLDLYAAIRERGRDSLPFYRTDVHLNEFGNRIVAEALAKWIREKEILGPA